MKIIMRESGSAGNGSYVTMSGGRGFVIDASTGEVVNEF